MRDTGLDTVKGIAIMMVLATHLLVPSIGMPGYGLNYLVLLIAVPAFFLVSSAVYRPGALRRRITKLGLLTALLLTVQTLAVSCGPSVSAWRSSSP